MIIISAFGSGDEDVETAFGEQGEAGKAWRMQAKGTDERFLAWEIVNKRKRNFCFSVRTGNDEFLFGVMD